MSKKNSWATFNFPLLAIDILTLIAAYIFSAGIYKFCWNDSFQPFTYIWMFFIFTIVFILFMVFLRMYNLTTFTYADRVVTRILTSVVFAGLVVISLFFMLQLKDASRLFFLLFCASSANFEILRRMAAKKCIPSGKRELPASMFIGNSDVYEEYTRYLDMTSFRCNFVSTLSYNDDRICTAEKFESYIIENNIHEVVIVYNHATEFYLKEYMSICEEMGLIVRLVLDMALEQMSSTKRFVYSIGTYPVLTYHNVSLNSAQLFMKSCFDIIVAASGLIIVSPILLITAIAIKLDSPGPVFFRQKRVGRNGKVFEIYKFRSMCIDAEKKQEELVSENKMKDGMMFKIDNDPRITRVGRFIRKYSIDELPQLFNVLRREMSLVGTRPPTVSEVEKYERKHRRRISILPGITGMWQVSGRSNITDFEDVVALDTEYIDHWSFLLDIKLLFKTAVTVLKRDGAY